MARPRAHEECTVDEQRFRELVEHYLLPMFSGASLRPERYPSTPGHATVAWKDPCRIWVKPARASDYRLLVERSQPFDLSDRKVVESFITILDRIAAALPESYAPDLLKSFERSVVACSANAGGNEAVMVRTIDALSEWSTQTYEGGRISAAIGFDVHGDRGIGRLDLSSLWDEDFLRVLSNGIDTILICNPYGKILRYESLPPPETPPSFAPLRLASIAAWAQNGRVAVALNRNGEILVLRDNRLDFAKRRGVWHHFTHEPIFRQMGRPQSQKVRRAIYETCLDTSFARAGGCIAVATSNNERRITDFVSAGDLIENSLSPKTKLMKSIISQKFQEIDRLRRQELVAIDGAVVLDHTGSIRAVGAIVKLPGGSTGGGRLAAAKQLSRLGLAMKISADGGIRAFKGGPNKPTREVFTIC